MNQLGGLFLTEFYAMVDRWARRATAMVETWPEDPREAPIDAAVQADTVRLAEQVAARAATVEPQLSG